MLVSTEEINLDHPCYPLVIQQFAIEHDH
jgi:hypothetical protein